MTLPTPDFTIITDLFSNTWTLGAGWIIPLVLAVLLMAFITRDVKKWGTLAFPIFVLERIMGMPVHMVLLVMSGIIFVIEVLSTQLVGRLLGAYKTPKLGFGKEHRMMKRLDKAEKMEKKRKRIAKSPLTLREIQRKMPKRYQEGITGLRTAETKKEQKFEDYFDKKEKIYTKSLESLNKKRDRIERAKSKYYGYDKALEEEEQRKLE